MSLAPERRGWITLGQMLVQDGILTDEQLSAALDRQRKSKERLGQILIEMRLIDEEVLLKYLGAPVPQGADHPAGARRPRPGRGQARSRGSGAPAPRDRRRAQRAQASSSPPPTRSTWSASTISVASTGLDVDFRIGPGSAIQEAIEQHLPPDGLHRGHRRGAPPGPRPHRRLAAAGRGGGRHQAAPHPGRRPAGRQGRELRAGPGRQRRRLRHPRGAARGPHARPLPHRRPAVRPARGAARAAPGRGVAAQDHLAPRHRRAAAAPGRELRLPIHGREIDFRVSTLPTIHGEKVVLRLLEKEAVVEHYSLENLGFDTEQLDLFMRGIRRPWGMVLLTGPTGSGKSTTLHTAIKAIKSPRKNIITVEDPVEYRQPGIQQVQVKTDIGFDFARVAPVHPPPGPRHHHDRRDPRQETAQIAVRAALTGHLVLSTLHTNDAVSTRHPADQHRRGALPRRHRGERGRRPAPGAEDLQALQGGLPALGRRDGRVRPRAESPRSSTGAAAARSAATSATPAAWRSTRCSGSTPQVRRLVLDGVDGDTIRKSALDNGMVTLRQAGLRQAVKGHTTLEEVMAVVADQD